MVASLQVLLPCFYRVYFRDEIHFNGEDADSSFRDQLEQEYYSLSEEEEEESSFGHSRSPFGLSNRCPVMPAEVEFFSGLLSTTKQILIQSSREPDSNHETSSVPNLQCATFKMAPPESVEADLLEYDKKLISLGKAFLFVTDLLKVQLEHFR